MSDNTDARVVVKVLGNSRGEIACRGGWGPARSSAETTELTKRYLERFYGDQVVVEYYDVADPEERERHADLIAKASQGYCVYPLVFVDDELESVGNAEYYIVLQLVRRALEQRERLANA